MADDVTDQDIQATLKAAGVTLPDDAPRPRALTRTEDLAETLRAAGIPGTVSDNGISLRDGGFNDTPDERAALRQRTAWKNRPPVGPGFPDPEPSAKAKALSDQTGYAGPFVSGMPIVGPALEHGTSALNAALHPDDPPNSTFSERYSDNLQTSRDATRWFEQNHPIGSTVASLAGGAAEVGPLAATKLGRLAFGMRGPWSPTMGAQLYGGLSGGALIGAGDAALRGENVPFGTTLGAAGGVLGPMVGEAARGLTRGAASYLAPRIGPLADMNTGAVNRLTTALEGETPASIAAAGDRMGPAGMLADVNHGMTDLAGGLADTTGNTHKAIVREAYRLRDAGARSRIEQAATDAAGPPVNLTEFEKSTTEARKAASDPLYDQFRSTVIPPTQELNDLVPRLKAAGAFDKAQKLAGITGEPLDLKFIEPDGAKASSPTAQTWDYVKRGLDSKIDDAYTSGDKTTARALVQLKGELLDQIQQAPGGDIYKQARAAFADKSSLIDQMQAGRDTFLGSRSGMTADELREELKGLSSPELDARIKGMRGAIQETMGATQRGDTTMRNQFLAPNNVEKLKLMIGDDKAKALVKTMEQEKYLKEQSQNVAGGSQTSPKSERRDALKLNPLPEYDPNLVQPTSWLPPSWVNSLRPSHIIDAARGQNHGTTLNQLARAVTTPAGPTMNDLIAAIQAEGNRQARLGNAGNRLGSLVTGGAFPASTAYRRSDAQDRMRVSPGILGNR